MSRPEDHAPENQAPEGFSTPSSVFPRQPRDTEGPVFAEPWQAQAFALTVKLHEAGCFTWKEWAGELGAQIAKAEKRAEAERLAEAEQRAGAGRKGQPDDGSRYYEHWLAALESLVTAKGLLDPASLQLRRNAWERAYRTTPHGQPVQLKV